MLRNQKTIPNFCIWSDLLGFGGAFVEGGWSLNNTISQKNVERLRRLENSLHRSNDPAKEVALVLNDGLARVYDFPGPRSDAMQFLWWLHTALSNHWLLNTIDIQHGSPGVRSVMSFGDRLVSWRGHTTYGDHFLGNTKQKLLADKKICIYSPDEFQLNLAFSKAYIIESSGSAAGLSGPNMYIDQQALEAIESYLCGCIFNHLIPDGSEDHGDYGLLKMRTTTASYEVTRDVNSDEFTFEIIRIVEGNRYDVMSMQFEASPINFNQRGIRTEIYRLKKYFPLDEEKTFFFDYQDYRWKT